PVPADGPSNVTFDAGSSFAQGDHASQLWKSFTWANTCAGGAVMLAVRAMRNAEGCMATKPTASATSTTKASKIFLSIKRVLQIGESARSTRRRPSGTPPEVGRVTLNKFAGQ